MQITEYKSDSCSYLYFRPGDKWLVLLRNVNNFYFSEIKSFLSTELLSAKNSYRFQSYFGQLLLILNWIWK